MAFASKPPITSSSFQRSFVGTTPFTAHYTPCPVVHSKAKKSRPARRSRLGRALLLQMLVSGSGLNSNASSTSRRNDAFVPSAVIYEEEQSPLRSSLLNSGVDDWSNEPSSQDWDGRALDGGSQNIQAMAGLIAVTAAGFFCTRAVGTLINHRSDLARIVPHPVAFSTASSTTDATSPRASLDDSRLRSRPLSPGSMDVAVQTHDRGMSPFPQESRFDRSTSMGSFVPLAPQVDVTEQTTEIDDAASITSAALEIDVASTASSLESSDLGSLDMRDVGVRNRGLQTEVPQIRSLTPDLIQKLPQELTIGTLRERAQLAMNSAAASTQAAQRAATFSAAASTASATASKASSQAMAAATMAHIALESGNIEQMTHAQTEAWKAVRVAAESEKRAAEAAAMATAYEDLAEQNARVARELSRPPPMTIFQAAAVRISAFFHPLTSAVVGTFTAVTQWCMAVWTYFSSGAFWRQICSLCNRSVAFAQAIIMSIFNSVKNAFLYIFTQITNFCSYVGNGVKQGYDSSLRFFKILYSRIFNPKGSIGGEASA